MAAFAGKTFWAMPMPAIGNIPTSGVDAGDYIRRPLSPRDEDQRLSGPMRSAPIVTARARLVSTWD
jgi:hypothetical protein